MTNQVNRLPCEIKEKPFRSYYKDDWRCDCESHTREDHIKILNGIFQVDNAHWFEFTDWQGKDDSCFWVATKDGSILSDQFRNAEYHGLMVSSIHVQGKRLSLSFKPIGWYE